MNIKSLLCLVSAVALASVGVAQAQSLPELAKLEKQRRAKLRAADGPAKVYTEGDRTGTATASAAPAEGDAVAVPVPPTTSPSGQKEKTPEELAAERQKAWADKVKAAQDQIVELEGVISKNERNLASLINITPARQDLANAIEADKKKLAALKQSLIDLEDERRRAGMPRR